MISKPSFFFEKKLWQKFPIIIGVDEVGRGAVAGPVVAGAVVFSSQYSEVSYQKEGIKIDDSKRLTERQRSVAENWIKRNCLVWAIGSTSTGFINRYGIVAATNKAFRQAIKMLLDKLYNRDQPLRVDPLQNKFLLADAFHIKYTRGIPLKNQKAIIKGDQKSLSIASASIIAKVYRDNLMVDLSCKRGFKKYKWDKNKGYGTKYHLEAIKRYGICDLHRKDFVKNLNNWSKRF